MNTNTFAQQAKIDADLARPTATLRNKITDSETDYWSGDDHIRMVYSARRKGFTVTLELTSDIARNPNALAALTASGINLVSTTGFNHSFALADAEAVESYIRTAFPES
ncbi:MAG: hypothetical protein LH624_01515 [Cryobacterium sp.]|nr:hypothetical protein [Cryobacterium sp.]